MSYGKKIAYLRKTKNMTQSDLGTLLNVTFQAVSKWERDESSPDFETMSKMAKYFNVPLSYFEEEQIVFEPALSVISPEQNAVLGVCTQCGKMLHEGEQSEESEVLICKQCVRRGEEAGLSF